jgi:hypothetical protein
MSSTHSRAARRVDRRTQPARQLQRVAEAGALRRRQRRLDHRRAPRARSASRASRPPSPCPRRRRSSSRSCAGPGSERSRRPRPPAARPPGTPRAPAAARHSLLEHPQPRERVRVVVAPCHGSRRLASMSPGSHLASIRITPASACPGRGARIGRSRLLRPAELHPRQHPVVVGVQRPPAPVRPSPSCSPCHGHTRLSPRTRAHASDAPMCGQASGPARSEPSCGPPQHQLVPVDRVRRPAPGRCARSRRPRTTRRSAAPAPAQRPLDARGVGLHPVGRLRGGRVRGRARWEGSEGDHTWSWYRSRWDLSHAAGRRSQRARERTTSAVISPSGVLAITRRLSSGPRDR